MEPRTRIALIGLGNDFRRDDGVGWAVLDVIRDRAEERPLPPEVDLSTCNGEPTRLVGLWHDADLAVVVESEHGHPGEPGKITRLDLDAEWLAQPMDAADDRVRLDGPVLNEAIELSRILGRLPRHLVVYAVQGADSSVGSGLSSTVTAMIEPVAAQVEAEIVRHRGAADRAPSWVARRRPGGVTMAACPRLR